MPSSKGRGNLNIRFNIIFPSEQFTIQTQDLLSFYGHPRESDRSALQQLQALIYKLLSDLIMQNDQPQAVRPQNLQYTQPKALLYINIKWSAKDQSQIKQQAELDYEIFHIHKAFDYQTHSVLPTLAQTKFPHLLSLHLNNLDLINIESICRLVAPQLSCLVLSSNNINSIRSLRKAYFPQLTKLSLYTNKIVDWSPIVELFTLKNCQLEIDRKVHTLFSIARKYRKEVSLIYPILKMSPNIVPYLDHKHNDTLKKSLHKIIKARQPK